MEFESISFVEPIKAINSPQDLKSFQNSSTYNEFFNFIQLAGESISVKRKIYKKNFIFIIY